MVDKNEVIDINCKEMTDGVDKFLLSVGASPEEVDEIAKGLSDETAQHVITALDLIVHKIGIVRAFIRKQQAYKQIQLQKINPEKKD